MDKLPVLIAEDLNPTRDYLRDVALVLGSLQRAFLPEHPREWQHGLEVMMRGISTQAFTVKGEEARASIDMVRNTVRLDVNGWALQDYDGSRILKGVNAWLDDKGVKAQLEEPEFSDSHQFDPEQAKAYAEALWWMDKQFRAVKSDISMGVISPVLLYPHHFDLSLSWFPWDDERQLGLGWSTGDETIPEPYIYLTAYPEPEGFTDLPLPEEVYWQSKGFSGAILPYAALQASEHPEDLLRQFVGQIFTYVIGRQLFN